MGDSPSAFLFPDGLLGPKASRVPRNCSISQSETIPGHTFLYSNK